MKQDEGEIDSYTDAMASAVREEWNAEPAGPDPASDKLKDLVGMIDTLPAAKRREVLSAMAAGASDVELLELIGDLTAERPGRVRVGATLAMIESLPDSDRSEILTLAQYEVPPLVVAYDLATDRQRKELDERRPPAPVMKERTKSKFHPATLRAPATDIRGGIDRLNDLLRDRAEQVGRGVVSTEGQCDAFRREASDCLAQVLGALERSQPVTFPRATLKVKWAGATDTERELWRKGEALGRTPELIDFNAEANAGPAEQIGPNPNPQCPLGRVAG